MSDADWPHWLLLLISWISSIVSAYFLGRTDEIMRRMRQMEREAGKRYGW